MKNLSRRDKKELEMLVSGISKLDSLIKQLKEDDVHTFTNTRKIAGLQDQIYNLLHISNKIISQKFNKDC